MKTSFEEQRRKDVAALHRLSEEVQTARASLEAQRTSRREELAGFAARISARQKELHSLSERYHSVFATNCVQEAQSRNAACNQEETLAVLLSQILQREKQINDLGGDAH